MESLWDNQTLKPNEIVLVEDGPLTKELYDVIGKWENRLGSFFKRVSLEENKGLGNALNIGLKHCNFDYVARMDTDDICRSTRFEKQITFLINNPDIDVLGTQVEEFDKKFGDLSLSRKLPTDNVNIIKFAKSRCPFNHPTVIFRKSMIQKVQGYQNDYLYEDYALWVKVISSGARLANLDECLVFMRSGSSMIKRRGGLKYALSEVKAQYGFYKIGFLSFFCMIKNICVRFPIRVFPSFIRAFLYKKVLRKNE